MGVFSSLWILVALHSLVAFSGKGRVMFSTLWVPQNRDSRDGLWFMASGTSQQVLGFGLRGILGLQCGFMVVQQRRIV